MVQFVEFYKDKDKGLVGLGRVWYGFGTGLVRVWYGLGKAFTGFGKVCKTW